MPSCYLLDHYATSRIDNIVSMYIGQDFVQIIPFRIIEDITFAFNNLWCEQSLCLIKGFDHDSFQLQSKVVGLAVTKPIKDGCQVLAPVEMANSHAKQNMLRKLPITPSYA